jgi:hemerythrin-like metal-binding protein
MSVLSIQVCVSCIAAALITLAPLELIWSHEYRMCEPYEVSAAKNDATRGVNSMALFRWRDSLEIGVPAIDRDHRRIIDLLNRLHFMVLAGDEREAVGKVITEVVRLTQYHFRREEALMRLADYPELAAHRAQHRAFVSQVAQFDQRYRGTPERFNMQEFYDFLADWLTVHMAREDTRIAPYVKNLPSRHAA